MVVNLIMRAVPTKIVCQSNRPAQNRGVRAGRLIWRGTSYQRVNRALR